eukprot:CAMPEP_0197895338 /NCGR_PEP_ID=MMETSP1439-20131203/37049_1 /TAXON_ID=66791 /ORGANISM="Gonyaulax spinifera, Strain CCMP409" /LENGTH=242 /DNA_ID=CAMNT_0043515765 /DNA_START=43 /DNA_END=771 /DNA_ORIENTATION=-
MAAGVVCFDFDDTLVLSEATKDAHFCTVAREHHGEAGDALMATLTGDRFERFNRYAEEVASRGIPCLDAAPGAEQVSGRALVEQYSQEIADIVGCRCSEVPGASAALDALQAEGVRIYLNSATPHEDLLLAVQSRGWSTRFAGVMGRPAGVPAEVSKVTNLRRILQETGVPAEQVVMVGDGESDRVGAAQVGCPFVGVRGRKPFKAEVPRLAEDMVGALELIRQLLAAPSATEPVAVAPDGK